MGTPLPTCFAAALGTRLILLGKLAKQEQRVDGSGRFRAKGSLGQELPTQRAQELGEAGRVVALEAKHREALLSVAMRLDSRYGVDAIASRDKAMRVEDEVELHVGNVLTVAPQRPAEPLGMGGGQSARQGRLMALHFVGAVGRGVHHLDVDKEQIARRKAEQAVGEKAVFVVQVADGISDHADDAAAVGALGGVVKLGILRQVMEVSLNGAEEYAGAVADGVGGVLVGDAEQGLTDVQQIEFHVGPAHPLGLLQAIKQVLSQPDLLLSVARPERDDIQTGAARCLQDPPRHRVERHVRSERRCVARLIREAIPVQGALVVQVRVCLLEGAAATAQHLEEVGEHADRIVSRRDPAVWRGAKIRVREVLPGQHAGLKPELRHRKQLVQGRLRGRVGRSFQMLDRVQREPGLFGKLRLGPACSSAAPPDRAGEVLRPLSINGGVRRVHLVRVLLTDVAQSRLDGCLVLGKRCGCL